ncbi:MAG: DUF4332 domain-containing protein [Actinomycetota bacterium]
MSSYQQAPRTTMQACNWPIAQLPGLSNQSQSQLQKYGIVTTRQLLQTTQTPDQRLALANQLQVHIQYVNKWVALADLARIPSVGCQYCGLLLHAGVASAIQLAGIPVHRLHQQILRLQVATMQRRDLCPTLEQVHNWVQQAQTLH